MPDPVKLIRDDHNRMRGLFDEFKKTEAPEERQRIVNEALVALESHARVEEEIFYPAARELVGDEMLVDHAEEEHHGAKVYVMELAQMKPDDPHYEAKFQVLSEVSRHHMEDEEKEMLPKIAEADAQRLSQIGEEMEHRWPGFRDEAQRMVDGGVFENAKAAFDQLQQATGRSPS